MIYLPIFYFLRRKNAIQTFFGAMFSTYDIGGGSSLLAEEPVVPTFEQLQTAAETAKTAYSNSSLFYNTVRTNFIDLQSSYKDIQNLSKDFTTVSSALTSTTTATITTTLGDGDFKFNVPGTEAGTTTEITIKDGSKADAVKIAQKAMQDIKGFLSNDGSTAVTSDNLAKVYAVLNTKITDTTDARIEGNDGTLTVGQLVEAVYGNVALAEDAITTNEAATPENLAKAQAAAKDILSALNKFSGAVNNLNNAFTAATKGGEFITDTNGFKDTAKIKELKTAITEQWNKAFSSDGSSDNIEKITNLKGTSGLEVGTDKADISSNSGDSINPTITENNAIKKVLALLVQSYPAGAENPALGSLDTTITSAEQIAAFKKLNLLLAELQTELTTMTVKTAVGTKSELANALGDQAYKVFANKLDVTTFPASVTTAEQKEAYLKAQFAEKIEKPIKEASKSVSNLTSGAMGTTAIINQAAQTNTMTRLAKLSTPYSKDFALASAIKDMNGMQLASGDNSALSSVISEYTKRFEQDNSLWANVLGAKGSTDNGDPKLYGFSVGYDRSFDNFILGSYFTYAKSKVDTSYLENESDNFELGIYSRAYFGQSELDTSISFGIAKNDINNYKLVDEYLNGDYDSKFANIAANYGYVFKMQDGFFIKPFIGLAYSYNKNDSFNLKNDVITQEFDKVDGAVLSANLGVEFRQYLSDGSFMFAAPGIEQELSVSKDDLVSKFNGASTSFTTKADESKNTYGKIIVGGEYAVSKDFSATLSAGIKANNDDRYVNGSLGLKYKF
ncbi:autotransporter domain protein [Campylobacter iguaniorum]|uniref:autotransporter family protein n=1 Tax=Campylobacter iguaniorum TaxID=1244531 RepID=UPI00073A64A3|nr:autotransporter domain-containing protein [Campylobacter iguaniorum]ALV24884.1 autotransporter domain protein [Campylobacter iguaniorum]